MEGRRHVVLRSDGRLGPDGGTARARASREAEGWGGQTLSLEGRRFICVCSQISGRMPWRVTRGTVSWAATIAINVTPITCRGVS